MFCMQYDSDNNNSNVYRAIDHCYTDTMVGIIPYCVADDTVYIILFLYKFGQYWLLSVARVYNFITSILFSVFIYFPDIITLLLPLPSPGVNTHVYYIL